MHKRLQRLICTSMAIGLASVLSISSLASAATTTPTLARWGGLDQYETASKIAEQGWTGTSEAVVLSAGMTPNLVDALAAGPLSAKLKAPMILTDGGNQLNAWAKQELKRLKPAKAYITSGSAVIKPSVLVELKGMGITPIELGGYDQYETSVNIAKEMINQGVQVSQVVLAAGWVTPADALSIAPIAATQGMPILATTRDTLPPSVKSFLASLSNVTNSYVIGGTAVVGDTVQAQLPGTVHRYAGLTKYDTNIQVLTGFKDVLQKDKLYLANGETLVDALAGVPLAAQSSSAILLTGKTLATASWSYALQSLPTEVIALGGLAVVPQTILEHVTSAEPLPQTEPTPSTGGGGGGGSNPVSTTIKVSSIKVVTTPTSHLTGSGSSLTFDLSGMSPQTQVIGFTITTDQSCDLQVEGADDSISLAKGNATLVKLDDLVPGTHGNNGISLLTLRAFLGHSVTIQGALMQDGNVVENISVTLDL